MREQFEKLPEIADSLSEHIYFGGDGFYHSSLVNFQGLVNWLNGAWYAWQAAKAQSVMEPSIDLNGHDIKRITHFMCYEDPENLDTEVTIQVCNSGFSGAGLYAWVAEYPEEGGIKLSESPQEQNQ